MLNDMPTEVKLLPHLRAVTQIRFALSVLPSQLLCKCFSCYDTHSNDSTGKSIQTITQSSFQNHQETGACY